MMETLKRWVAFAASVIMESKIKSIYNQDDLSCNAVGMELKYEAENFFKAMLEKFPDYNPREMVELCAAQFSGLASRRILELRKLGVLKGWEK